MASIDQSREKAKADGRADFLRRFFAVAIGVGFATKLTTFQFLVDVRTPDQNELSSILTLVFAVIVIVGSWDFYFTAIVTRPLYDISRFFLDIIVVSMYILMLNTTHKISSFYIYFSSIFVLYVIWDYMTVSKYPNHYGLDSFSHKKYVKLILRSVLEKDGRAGSSSLSPFISVWWLVSFLLVAIKIFVFDHPEIYLIAFSCLMYCIYRRDQQNPYRLFNRAAFTIICLGGVFFNELVSIAIFMYSVFINKVAALAKLF
jgi:hypothetical protein